MADDLYRVVYVSRAMRPMTAGELEDLLEGARKRNEANDVTGLMLYEAGNFVQVLEGPRATVDRLYERIAQDPRHRSVERISAGPIERRDFEGWAMGFADLVRYRDLDVSEFREQLAGTDPLEPRATYGLLLKFRESMR